MYIHIGNEKIIRSEEIIGVFDMDTTTISKLSRDFLKNAEFAGKIVEISLDLPKSFVLCGTENFTKIYLAPIATSTIRKRANSNINAGFCRGDHWSSVL